MADTRDSDVVTALREALRGPVIAAGDPGYDEASAVYNAMIDKRPTAIAQCANVADVMAAVRVCHQAGSTVSVRGGGHNAGGLGVADGAVCIDLAHLDGIHIDPAAGTVRAEGGATLGDVDHATHAFGLAVPAGIISTTGVGGLTLGGGIGYLTRKAGLTIDNLLAADVVLADGTLVTCDATRHPDLFWALRGGGGNFGIVTSFLFRAAQVKNVFAGPVLYDLDDTPELLRWYREVLPGLPEDLNGFFAVLTVPPGPPFPEELHLRKVAGVVWCYSGPAERAEEVLAPVRSFGKPIMDGIMEMPFPMWNSAFDALYPPGYQWYWRSDSFDQITDDAIEAHHKFGTQLPSMFSTMHLYSIDGAAHRVAAADTAFGPREAIWSCVIVGVDPEPAKAVDIKDWAIGYWDALHPSSIGGAYVNFMMEEGADRVRASYGANYDRLAKIKAVYDPDNFFHVNQNIKPAGG